MTTPLLIEDTNISHAWIEVLNYIVSNPGKEICPLVLSITEFEENTEIKTKLNSSLQSKNLASIQTVSETIFPKSLYLYCKKDRNKLYNEYSNNLPRLKKIDSSNKKGTYFGRLMEYEIEKKRINQLEIIISSLKNESNATRRSKLQASIFNPLTDHTNAMYQGFPCLQHVTFYKTKNNGLVLNSFYAIQHLYRRAYGNWLGLINLGKFVAEEADLRFERFNCHVGIEQLDRLTKAEAQLFLQSISTSQKILFEL